MDDWFSGDVVANGVRLHYYRTGGDKPPLVLCHGFTCSAPIWFPVARDLEAQYDVIMYDARGHGGSGAPETGYDYTTLAADLAGLIGALELPQPRLWGHSMGAGTVAMAAAEHPDLLSCAILEDPPWLGDLDPEQVQRWITDGLEERRVWYAEWQSMTREALIARYRERFSTWPDETIEPTVDSRLQFRMEALNFFATCIQPWRELAPRFACPVLLLTGDPQLGSIVTSDVAAEAARLWREGRVVKIANAGHDIHQHSYAAVMAEVRAFLAEQR